MRIKLEVISLCLVAAVLAWRVDAEAPPAADAGVNVARPVWGATADASSIYGPGYEADNVLDGRWAVRETDKWNSSRDAVPYWVRIDLGTERIINRIVIHHETEAAISSDFELQHSGTREGPWNNLTEPITGNHSQVTTHTFPAVKTRFVRLLINKAEQNGNEYGRIFEIEVYSPATEVKMSRLQTAEMLMRDADSGAFAPDQASLAGAMLDDPDPWVRALAECALSLYVGKANNGEVNLWPPKDPPLWYAKWSSIPLPRLIEMDWVRQAVALGIHHNPEKLRASIREMLARATRHAAAVEPGANRSKIKQQMAVLEKLSSAAHYAKDAAALRALWLEARRAERAVAFADPAVDFESVLFYTRSALHYKPNVCGVQVSWAYKPGGDVVIVSGIEKGAKVRTLLNGGLGAGHVHGIDLWFDADRIAFAWASQPSWPPVRPTGWPRPDNQCFAFELREDSEPPHLYEMRSDGSGIRQLTDHNYWSDIEPTYCPDGSIAFTSDRSAHSPSCDGYENDLTDTNLYLQTPDRKYIRRLTNQKDVDMHPHLLDNGLIGYLRWEYQERHFWDVHAVWTVRPDGTGCDALYKQHFGDPASVRDARPVPGSDKLVAVAAGHHTIPLGPVVLLNPASGVNTPEGIETVTPGCYPQERSEVAKREDSWSRGAVPQGGVKDAGGYYQTPYALSDTCFLVSYASDSIQGRKYSFVRSEIDSNGAGVYLVNSYGDRELIYRHPLYCAVSPMPFRKRQKPPVLPNSTDYSKNYATCLISDVYQGLTGVERGTVKYVRISEALPWPIVPGEGVKRWDLSNRWCPVRVIGTVPVERDGSAHFKVPTMENASVYFQALDENYMEIRRMRTSVSFQPGEKRSCGGCHESRAVTPMNSRTIAASKSPVFPTPPAWGSRRAIGYEWLVQPVLDRNCVSCHGGARPAGSIDLSPGRSYNSIVQQHRLVALSNRESDGSVTQVEQFGSRKSKLTMTLVKGHKNVKLPKEDWLALVTWVDANAPKEDRMLSKRTSDGRTNVWELYPWKDPWAPSKPVPALGQKINKLNIPR